MAPEAFSTFVSQALRTFTQHVFFKVCQSGSPGHFPSVLLGEALRGVRKRLMKFLSRGETVL